MRKREVIFSIFLCCSSVFGSDEVDGDIPITDSVEVTDTTVVMDTITYIRTDELNRFAEVDNQINFEERLTQHPTVALVKSMVIPGLGQFGNRKFVKGLFFFGFDAWFVSSAFRNKSQASDLRDNYEQETSISLRNDIYSRFEDKRDQRNKFTWFAVIVTFVSMFDAYADAHLSGFPVRPDEEELGIQMGPNADGGLSASLVLSF